MVPLLPWTIGLAFVASLGYGAGHKGGPITCECSTVQCSEQKTTVCTTEGLCFAQYLDRGLGSPSLLRGCTEGRTPILCENRKPTRAKNWPLLHCCDADFCNRDAVPTPPSATADGKYSPDVATSDLPRESSPSSRTSSVVQMNPWPHIVSPVYVSVLVLGIVSLVLIGIAAALVIRRNNRFYADRYGELEFQPGKDCDSEEDSEVASSQPYLHVVCQNRSP